MRFTKSIDGVKRTTIKPKGHRFTEEEIENYNRMAVEAGYKDYRNWLDSQITSIVHFSFEKLKEAINY